MILDVIMIMGLEHWTTAKSFERSRYTRRIEDTYTPKQLYVKPLIEDLTRMLESCLWLSAETENPSEAKVVRRFNNCQWGPGGVGHARVWRKIDHVPFHIGFGREERVEMSSTSYSYSTTTITRYLKACVYWKLPHSPPKNYRSRFAQ